MELFPGLAVLVESPNGAIVYNGVVIQVLSDGKVEVRYPGFSSLYTVERHQIKPVTQLGRRARGKASMAEFPVVSSPSTASDSPGFEEPPAKRPKLEKQEAPKAALPKPAVKKESAAASSAGKAAAASSKPTVRGGAPDDGMSPSSGGWTDTRSGAKTAVKQQAPRAGPSAGGTAVKSKPGGVGTAAARGAPASSRPMLDLENAGGLSAGGDTSDEDGTAAAPRGRAAPAGAGSATKSAAASKAAPSGSAAAKPTQAAALKGAAAPKAAPAAASTRMSEAASAALNTVLTAVFSPMAATRRQSVAQVISLPADALPSVLLQRPEAGLSAVAGGGGSAASSSSSSFLNPLVAETASLPVASLVAWTTAMAAGSAITVRAAPAAGASEEVAPDAAALQAVAEPARRLARAVLPFLLQPVPFEAPEHPWAAKAAAAPVVPAGGDAGCCPMSATTEPYHAALHSLLGSLLTLAAMGKALAVLEDAKSWYEALQAECEAAGVAAALASRARAAKAKGGAGVAALPLLTPDAPSPAESNEWLTTMCARLEAAVGATIPDVLGSFFEAQEEEEEEEEEEPVSQDLGAAAARAVAVALARAKAAAATGRSPARSAASSLVLTSDEEQPARGPDSSSSRAAGGVASASAAALDGLVRADCGRATPATVRASVQGVVTTIRQRACARLLPVLYNAVIHAVGVLPLPAYQPRAEASAAAAAVGPSLRAVAFARSHVLAIAASALRQLADPLERLRRGYLVSLFKLGNQLQEQGGGKGHAVTVSFVAALGRFM